MITTLGLKTMTHRVNWLRARLMASTLVDHPNLYYVGFYQYNAEQTAYLLNLSTGRCALKDELIHEIERRCITQIARPIIASLTYDVISDLVCSYFFNKKIRTIRL